jgi:hypothetical protein
LAAPAFLPKGYVLGEEAGGAFIGGLRYGEGMLCEGAVNAAMFKVREAASHAAPTSAEGEAFRRSGAGVNPTRSCITPTAAVSIPASSSSD